MTLQVSHQIFSKLLLSKLQSLIFTFTANIMGIYGSKLNLRFRQVNCFTQNLIYSKKSASLFRKTVTSFNYCHAVYCGNAYSTSVALIIATFCDFIAIKIQAGNVSNKILNMQSIVHSFHKLKPLKLSQK